MAWKNDGTAQIIRFLREAGFEFARQCNVPAVGTGPDRGP